MIRPRHNVTCAFDGCGTVIGKGKIFCPDHYFALPKPLRDDLWRTWRRAFDAWKYGADAAEQDRANRAYGAAYRAAAEYLRTAPANPIEAKAPVAFAADGRAVRYAEGRML